LRLSGEVFSDALKFKNQKMEIDHTHFINTLSPAEKLNYLKWVGSLNAGLKLILEQELQLGNSIASVTTSWPEEGSICVCLKKSFTKLYSLKETEYQEINDLHYGKAQYVSLPSPKHLLMCAE
jgi:hypothetical protein